MELSNRLKAICDLCDKGHVVADIGCDHGYVSITLTNNRIFDKALAMDINEGPLRLCMQNIKAYGDGSRIETRLSNGLEGLEPGEADAVIIAGMGGILVRDILAAGDSKLKGVKQLILGAQSDLELVRKHLRDIGFSIKDEDMILEDGKYYQLIKAVAYDNKTVSDNLSDDLSSDKYQEVLDRFGPVLLASKNDVLYKFLNHEKLIREDIVAKLTAKLTKENQIGQTVKEAPAGTLEKEDRVASRVREIQYELSLIDEALSMF